ncbi:DUF2975 domain-containing protein [Pelagicoccus mobilis]|uniref:DUF2975 domain-containing protein n=1 Tax=Pelagicoccus mobilis TaxID=415221 RepID=A0A934VU39_9BACT|nr:DUF2975 domain-containing protein [Pelagicoccus mobilis]MBK1880159.1 DUF2975 domain-containing protein [Pelagicoccus mobilis]
MKARSRSLAALKFIAGFCWWGGLVSCGGLVVLVVLEFSGVDTFVERSVQGYASSFDTSAFSVESKDGFVGELELEEPVIVRVKFGREYWDERPAEFPIFVFLTLGFMGIFLAPVWHFRKLLESVERGEAFAAANAKRLRTLGSWILVGVFWDLLMELIVSGIADSALRPQGFTLNGHLSLNGGLLVAGLCVFALSEVFRLGAKMREEQELTI